MSETPPDFAAQVFASEAGRAVFRDWEACITEHGLARDETLSPWAVLDETGQQPPGVGTAVIDARCKTDVDFVQRLAQLQANLEAPFIAAHRDELDRIRDDHDRALTSARAYVVDHG